jgi:ribosomal protein L21
MKAIIVLNKTQYRIAQGERFLAELSDAKNFAETTTESFRPDSVVLIESDDGKVIYSPKLESVELKAVKSLRSDKIRTMKYKRRKRYNVYRTSRRAFVEVHVESISL